MPLLHEHWRDIPSHEGAYQVSDQGRVRSLDRRLLFTDGRAPRVKGRILRPGSKPSGHLSVYLPEGSRDVHALVLRAFVGPRPMGLEARHLDGNEKNNRISNLEYATLTRNSQDKKWHKGASNHTLKLKPADILDIKRRLGLRETGRALAREFKVNETTISCIKLGKIHKDVL